MNTNQKFILVAICAIVALAFGSIWGQVWAWQGWGILAGAFLIGSFFLPDKIKLAAICGFVIALSLMRTWFVAHIPQEVDVDFWNNETVISKVQGVICREPDVRHEQTKYRVCVHQVAQNEEVHFVEGEILLSHDKWPAFDFGDKIEIVGYLKAPFVSEEFDYGQYLQLFGIFSEMRHANVAQIGESEFPFGEGWDDRFLAWSYEGILDFKEWFVGILNRIFPEPQASFLDGLLRGAKKGLPDEVFDDFQKTGLTHIIAVSGFNITIIASVIMAIFGRINRRLGAIATVLGIVFFVVFTGMSDAVIRAGIMGGIGAMAIFTGRQQDAITAILLAAWIMALQSPLMIFYGVGFQLSFLSTLGLILISPLIEKFTEMIPDFMGLTEAFLLTISAQVMVVPLIAFHFERISLISPFTNVLVAPFIVFAMGAGFLAILAGIISPILGKLVGIPAYLSLSVILWIAHKGAQMSWAEVEVQIGLVSLVIYYILLGIFLGFAWQRWDPKKKELDINAQK